MAGSIFANIPGIQQVVDSSGPQAIQCADDAQSSFTDSRSVQPACVDDYGISETVVSAHKNAVNTVARDVLALSEEIEHLQGAIREFISSESDVLSQGAAAVRST